jgi:hypothetical protein
MNYGEKMDRRKFLQITGLVAGCAAVGAGGIAVAENLTRDAMDSIKEIFNRKVVERHGAAGGKDLALRIEAEFQKNLSLLPYLGSEKENRWTAYMPPAAFALSAYRILVPGDMAVDSFAKMFFEAVKEQTQNLSSYLMRLIGTDEGMKANTRLLAERSLLRAYPEDWVMDFVEGNGEYSYGIDVTECAIKKFLDRRGAPELTKYLCLTDYLTSEAVGRGLVRTKTLAEGCAGCDFRYRQGRASYLYPLRNGWPPQFVEPGDRNMLP